VQDVRERWVLPSGVELLTAGFPCQDLSQAGRTAGIAGSQSGLVGEVFRRLRSPRTSVRWLLLENVSFMLSLDRGRAMHHLVEELEHLGFAWAYRIVDSIAFGVPQRRRRVLLLASRDHDPRGVLLGTDAGEPKRRPPADVACGFYWTEGLRGLGWAVDAVPTLKGGSTIGIASPPAIWFPADRRIVTPDVRDAERMQGFPADWTAPALDKSGRRVGARWKLVGNAVTVPVARWLGDRLARPESYQPVADERPLRSDQPWPNAAYGGPGRRPTAVGVSLWPIRRRHRHLVEFLKYPTVPLSARATAGFLDRARRGSLNFAPGFLDDVAIHAKRMAQEQQAVA
jgi:DNA (cytosine-5)-methyltransferase 1